MAITRAQIARQLLNGGGASSNRGDRQGVGRGDKGKSDFGQFERRQRQNQALQGAGFLGKDEGMNVGPQKNILQRGFETFKPLPLRLIDALGNIGSGTPVDTTMFNRGGDGQGVDPMLLYKRMMAQQARITDNVPTEDEEEKKLEGLRLVFRAEGGIIDEETGRQMYGLGKLVRKATRAVKKVAKSPIGKAALLYAGTAGLGALGAGAARAGTGFGIFAPSAVKANLGTAFTRFMGGKLAPNLFDEVALTGKQNLLQRAIGSFPGGVGGAITAVSLLPLLGLGTGDESEEEAQAILDQSGLDIAAIRANPNQYLAPAFKAEGGRIGYDNGGYTFDQFKKDKFKVDQFMGEEQMRKLYEKMMREKKIREQRTMVAEGGSMKEPVAKKTMPLLDMGGQEMDLRAEGGFVPIGRMEKADDVPARLSKNEFVFTADAVRNAGDGNVDKGAEVMYNMMKNLEAGGEVSEESQGLEGARRMFQTSQRLEEVL